MAKRWLLINRTVVIRSNLLCPVLVKLSSNLHVFTKKPSVSHIFFWYANYHATSMNMQIWMCHHLATYRGFLREHESVSSEKSWPHCTRSHPLQPWQCVCVFWGCGFRGTGGGSVFVWIFKRSSFISFPPKSLITPLTCFGGEMWAS